MPLKIIRKLTVTQIIGILPIIVYLLILVSKIWSFGLYTISSNPISSNFFNPNPFSSDFSSNLNK
jgi:hypothetical protein